MLIQYGCLSSTSLNDQYMDVAVGTDWLVAYDEMR